MPKKTIHLVSLDVPFPPDYGGMTDVFYRLKALHELGFSIILHCFTYGRGKPKELNKYCEKIYFYNRKKQIKHFFSKRPFIVESRRSKLLLNNLLQDNFPILLEGLHCCYFLEHPEITKKTVLVRTHNIEHKYYKGLSQDAFGWKKLFFKLEAKKLKSYETILSKADYLLTINQEEQIHFKKINASCFYLPASLPQPNSKKLTKPKNYVLFHGNLSVPENQKAVFFLLKKVIPHIPEITFYIAGKNPNSKLISLAEKQNAKVIANPSQEEMDQLIAHAKIHVLPAVYSTGLKLKLLAALQSSGITIANDIMFKGNDLEKYCIKANTPEEFISAIKFHYKKPIDLPHRKKQIENFLNEINPKKHLNNIFKEIELF